MTGRASPAAAPSGRGHRLRPDDAWARAQPAAGGGSRPRSAACLGRGLSAVLPGSGEFRVPIWKHQSSGNCLAEMLTKLTAARQLKHRARAPRKWSGQNWSLRAFLARANSLGTDMTSDELPTPWHWIHLAEECSHVDLGPDGHPTFAGRLRGTLLVRGLKYSQTLTDGDVLARRRNSRCFGATT